MIIICIIKSSVILFVHKVSVSEADGPDEVVGVTFPDKRIHLFFFIVKL